MTIQDGIFTGFVIGLLLATPAVIFEMARQAKELPLLMDIKTFWGAKLTPHQVLFWSVATHLATSALFGALIPFLASLSIISPFYPLGEVMLFSLAFFLITGLIVFPVIGFGFFGHKEGGFVWLELLLTNLLYGFLFWGAAQIFFI